MNYPEQRKNIFYFVRACQNSEKHFYTALHSSKIVFAILHTILTLQYRCCMKHRRNHLTMYIELVTYSCAMSSFHTNSFESY